MKETINKIKRELAGLYSDGEIKNIIRIIFENMLGYSPVDMILHTDDAIMPETKERIDKVIERLKNHEPIQYIFNEAYFYGMTLKVTRDTLIPRPETEELVDMIVKRNSGSDLVVLDIGTGSGAIAIALARNLKFPIVTATDVSEAALAVAKENAKTLKANVTFKLQDILKVKCDATNEYDIIVSNPPYITEQEKAEMEPNVLDYEPATALFVPNNNPLLFYKAIAEYALEALKPKGELYFEINGEFGNEMSDMLTGKGFANVEIIRDMYGKDRFARCTKQDDED